MSICALSDALTCLLPGSVVARRTVRPWHSATFSGHCYKIELVAPADGTAIEAFTRNIGEHEFAFSGQLVVDIAVTARVADQDGSARLTVEALLLDEEL